MWPSTEYPGRLTDGQYTYDTEGRAWDRPDTYVPGLPGEDNNGPGGPGAGGGGGGGGMEALLASPYFQQARAASEAQNAAQEASTREFLRQLLIQTGIVPEGFQDKLGVLDEVTRNLIGQNTSTGISQIARLNEGYADQKTSDINQLAARGLGRSGAKGYKLRRAALTFDRSKADLLAGVSGKINSSLGELSQGQLQRQQSLGQFLSQLAQTFRFGDFTKLPARVDRPNPATGPEWNPGGWQPEANPSQDYNTWVDAGSPTYGGGTIDYGYGTAYAPAKVGQGGGFTSPQKPLLMY
jgi:hypothetical protein